MKLVLYLAFAATMLLLPTQAMARHICWIDHVTSAPGGIAVFFAVKPKLQAYLHPVNRAPEIRYAISGGAVDDGAGKRGNLLLHDGDFVSLTQTQESSCTLTAEVSGTRQGVSVESALALPGSSLIQGDREFIPAE